VRSLSADLLVVPRTNTQIAAIISVELVCRTAFTTLTVSAASDAAQESATELPWSIY
jgi:hypothetical protein